MEKVRYMISDAAQIAGVESHVLRYWEDELGLRVPRNELGHRYYTKENIRDFQRIKELKEQGYQLKAIRMVLHGEDPAADMAQCEGFDGAQKALPQARREDAPEAEAQSTEGAQRAYAAQNSREEGAQNALQTQNVRQDAALSAEDRMDQFRELMSDIVGRAIARNNEELSQNIGREVQERVLKEMDYLAREQEDAAEERYRKLDAAIRGSFHNKKKSLFSKSKTKREKKGGGNADKLVTE